MNIFLSESAKLNNSLYYRIVGKDNIGIYETLKRKFFTLYNGKEFLENKDVNWLPLPKIKFYEDNMESYFTAKGYNTFVKKTLPIIQKYLTSSDFKIEEFDKLEGKIVYQDAYQIVTKNSG